VVSDKVGTLYFGDCVPTVWGLALCFSGCVPTVWRNLHVYSISLKR